MNSESWPAILYIALTENELWHSHCYVYCDRHRLSKTISKLLIDHHQKQYFSRSNVGRKVLDRPKRSTKQNSTKNLNRYSNSVKLATILVGSYFQLHFPNLSKSREYLFELLLRFKYFSNKNIQQIGYKNLTSCKYCRRVAIELKSQFAQSGDRIEFFILTIVVA